MSDESFMYAVRESDNCIVPAKAPNKDPQGSAEGLEGRQWIKENTGESNPSRTRDGKIGSRGLPGVREAAKKDKGKPFYIPILRSDFMPSIPNIRDKSRVR